MIIPNFKNKRHILSKTQEENLHQNLQNEDFISINKKIYM